MTYGTHEKLCDIHKPYLEYRGTNYKTTLPIYKAITLVLRKLAFGQNDHDVGDEFEVGEQLFLDTLLF